MTSGDIAGILAGAAALLTVSGVILKYIVRSEIRSEVGAMQTTVDKIPEMIHQQVEDHVQPIERRTRVTESLTANLYGLLAGHGIVDQNEYNTARQRFVDGNRVAPPEGVR